MYCTLIQTRTDSRAKFLLLGCSYALFALLLMPQARGKPVSLSVHAADKLLQLEIMQDDLIHFQWKPTFAPRPSQRKDYTPTNSLQPSTETIQVSPYINVEHYPQRYPGPSRLKLNGNSFETTRIRGLVTSDLSLEIYSKSQQLLLRLKPSLNRLSFTAPPAHHLYGLGEQFLPEHFGHPNTDWLKHKRTPGIKPFGNALVYYHGGAVGNAQFPILYMACRGDLDLALFMDDPYCQEWDFTSNPWTFKTEAKTIKGFIMIAPDFPGLRTNYMKLTGFPPVPPRKMFGLWVSEYGFDNWDELLDKLFSLRSHRFPLDGFILDLQWFGGIKPNSPESSMGKLTFDLHNFPHPAAMIDQLKTDGIGLITIEEAYISQGLDEYKLLGRKGYLARQNRFQPRSPSDRLRDVFLVNEKPWWGLGGLLDYSNPEAGKFWHDLKRQKLVDLGVLGHWTDLGEPEMFRHKTEDGNVEIPYYYKGRQQDIHNLFSLYWSRSIFEGYKRHQVTRRPFILTRSGGPGIQRYGAAMWSGDIATNFGSLAAQFNVAGNMSLSGIDFFGSDIGGFHREAFKGGPSELNELYTQWFADSCYTDIPVRPHTENLQNNRETAPDRIGWLESNLYNIRERYRLIPYYYSLAHLAHRHGTPLIAPLVYHFSQLPSDPDYPNLDPWRIEDEKMLGPYILTKLVAKAGATTTEVYLPPGLWVDYHHGRWFKSKGLVLNDVPLYRDKRFSLPCYIKAGAIIPIQHVDSATRDSFGTRRDGSQNNELGARIVPGKTPTSFTVFEDDGITTRYLEGAIALTPITQQDTDQGLTVTIHSTQGDFDGVAERRKIYLEVYLPPQKKVKQILINGESLPERDIARNKSAPGYYIQGPLLVIKTRELPIRTTKVIQVRWTASAFTTEG